MFGYRSNVPKVRLTTDRLVVRLVHERDAWRLADYYAENRHFLKPWEPVRDESHCYPSGWQARLGMIGEFHKQGSAFYFALLDPEEKEIIGVANFSNVVRGSFHACYLGYSIAQKWQGQGLMFEALTAAIRYMQRTQHIHRIMANYMPHNKRSGALLARLGFEKEGYAKDYLLIDGQWRDHVHNGVNHAVMDAGALSGLRNERQREKTMKYELTATEARVIGCLLEKQVTTPEQYPLSVNGVVTACNQKTNREPVMNLTEQEVQEQLDNLVKRHFLRTVSGFGNRVTKYEQRFCNSEFGDLKLSAAEVALVTTLLLRGAQTPGELRSRASRMHEFSDMAEVESTLERLASREDGPYVVRLAREPGKRESRYIHLFCGDVDELSLQTSAPESASGDLQSRVEALESEVAELKQRLDSLLAHLGE
ncbi:YceH protein [Salmonella enterica subsp. enterica serovar Paratyphi A str. JX05-19]|nr:YceH protein [Salmonella enterica subsp. enterica serovar Paratyphi A str. JX05-19]